MAAMRGAHGMLCTGRKERGGAWRGGAWVCAYACACARAYAGARGGGGVCAER